MRNISSFSSPLLLLLPQRNNNDNNNNKSNRLNLLIWFNRVIPSNLDYNKTIMADMFHPKKIPSFVSVYRRKLKLTLSQGNKGMKVVYVYTYTRGGDESDKGSSKRKKGGGKVLAFSRKSEFVTSGSRCHFENGCRSNRLALFQRAPGSDLWIHLVRMLTILISLSPTTTWP